MMWTKSSRSQLGQDRVEVAPVWIKARRSMMGTSCVEAAPMQTTIWVRDSKHPTGPNLVFDRSAWTNFIRGVQNGEFDL